MAGIAFEVITLFPEMFAAIERSGITRRAMERSLWRANYVNPRDYATDAHRTVDDRPYGGGPGMVMMAQPLADCLADPNCDEARLASALDHAANAREQAATPGPIKGQPNRVWDAFAQKEVIGRFGWKANTGSIAHQSAGAFNGDADGFDVQLDPGAALRFDWPSGFGVVHAIKLDGRIGGWREGKGWRIASLDLERFLERHQTAPRLPAVSDRAKDGMNA